jgi:hypothetical protein
MDERNRFIMQLGIVCRKATIADICINRLEELLKPHFGIWYSAHLNVEYLSNFFGCKRLITTYGVERKTIDSWLAYCDRAGVKVEEVDDFF